jgi:hypothetical protein
MVQICLPDHLKDRKHEDYKLWPFNQIPRAWTAFCWGRPKLIAGNQTRLKGGAPKPIGEPGSWQISYYPDVHGLWKLVAWYIALTLPNWRHFRLGARWDDVDNYVQWPSIATRWFPANGERDTST